MFRFVGKLFTGVIRTIVFAVVLIMGIIVALYFWYANSQLKKAVSAAGIKGGFASFYDVTRRKYARVETGWPLVLRVEIKASGEHNWIPTKQHGLVRLIAQWSPEQGKWVEEPHEALPMEQWATLKAMVQSPTNGGLIEALSDRDRNTREVAFRELVIRTQQTFGFDPDGPELERIAAAHRWEQWWEANKVNWTTGRVLDKLGEVLEQRK